MLSVIAGAPEGEWFDMPEGTVIEGKAVGRMEIARIRRVNGDLDVEDIEGRVWRFTEVSFSDVDHTYADGNVIVERDRITWTRGGST